MKKEKNKKLIILDIVCFAIAIILFFISCFLNISNIGADAMDNAETQLPLVVATRIVSYLFFGAFVVLVIITAGKRKGTKAALSAIVVTIVLAIAVSVTVYSQASKTEYSQSSWDTDYTGTIAAEYQQYYPYYSKMEQYAGDGYFQYSYTSSQVFRTKYVYIESLSKAKASLPSYDVEYFETGSGSLMTQFTITKTNVNDVNASKKDDITYYICNDKENVHEIVIVDDHSYYSYKLTDFDVIEQYNEESFVNNALEIYSKIVSNQ